MNFAKSIAAHNLAKFKYFAKQIHFRILQLASFKMMYHYLLNCTSVYNIYLILTLQWPRMGGWGGGGGECHPPTGFSSFLGNGKSFYAN